MYVSRIFSPFRLLQISIKPILFLLSYSWGVVYLYSCIGLGWLKIPWVPISLIGIAVSFYVGFKNKAAYDRTWEARKIWGGIVNSSRSWGIMVNGFVTDEFLKQDVLNFEIEEVRRRLIYRQIAWLYRLKRQLRILKPWEHNKYVNRRYREYINELFPNQDESIEIERFLINDDVERILKSANGCSQILYCQSEDLKKIKQLGLVDSFRHVEMQKMLTEFFTLQGKCERIKNFPLPRQYASSSVYFVYIFILLLPMGLLSVFSNTNLNEYMIWGVVPFTTLVGWVFWMMERVGDYAENPFENLAFDIPMTSLVRTIEIDLREMLNEMDIPKPILSKDDFIV